jgi:hypothetical protein
MELVKRNGDREDFDCVKLARSIRQAGVPVYSVSAMVARACILPVRDTTELRRRVEQELARRYPVAARNYASTRRWPVAASDVVVQGQAGFSPATAARVGIGPGETVRVEFGGSTAALKASTLDKLAPDHVWLNYADLARAGIGPASRATVSRTRHGTMSSPDSWNDAAGESTARPQQISLV